MTSAWTVEAGSLTLEKLRDFRRTPECKVLIDPQARERMARTRRFVERRIEDGLPTYGINTGFGALSGHAIGLDQLAELQRRLVLSNAAGVGPLMSVTDVRCMMVLKISAIATGRSGVRPELADALASLLNAGITPCVPSQGSVGASGDLAPLAHVAAGLIGVGDAYYRGEILDARRALRSAGLEPFTLAPKEGLALVNGTQASTALALSGLFAAERIFAAALVASLLSLELVFGQMSAFDPRLHLARGQVGQIEVAALCWSLLQGSEFRNVSQSRDRLQDPYCLRCVPQVMGACFDQLSHAAKVLAVEINAWTDNPMVDEETGEVLYGGNFHAEPVGMIADGMALAIAEIGAMSERRIALLTDPLFSKLPAFLVAGAGLDCGFMVAQVTAAALASENKSLAHPATVDSIPTCANQEDFVSMATYASRRLANMAENAAAIVAIELLAAAQGLEFRRPARTGERLERFHESIRSRVGPYDQDRFFAPDIASIKELVLSAEFVEVLSPALRLD